MEVRITNEPYMLLETVELLHAFVNEMPVEDLTAPGIYTIPPVELQSILRTATEGLSRQDPALQFFFLQEPIQNETGERTCLAKCMAYNSMDFSCRTLASAMESLRENWRAVRRRGEHFSAIGEFGMDYTDPCAGFVPLSQDVERLEVSPMYRQKLLEVFSGFDEYTAFLERILEPVADRLEKLLEPWARRAEPLAKDWEIYYRSPAAREQLQQRSCCSIDNSVETICLNLRYLQPKAGPGVMDDETGTVYFHTGVAQAVERKTPLDFEDWEYHALRLLGSPARMKMLQAMSEQSMTSREMAQQLGLHLGAVGRDVKSLYDARLLLVEAIHGRNRYKTNFTAIETIIQHLQALQKHSENKL